MSKSRQFATKKSYILVKEGKIVRCVHGNEKVVPEYGNFYFILRLAMEDLYKTKPSKFEELTKIFALESKEYELMVEVRTTVIE